MTNNLIAQAGQIVNPVVTGIGSGGNAASGVHVASLLATFIRVMVIVGGLGFVLYFIIGAINWISSGGEKGKVETAKQEITNALTGLVILLAFYAVAAFLKTVLKIDLLNIIWPTPSGVATPTP
jgi:hypothetical protein